MSHYYYDCHYYMSHYYESLYYESLLYDSLLYESYYDALLYESYTMTVIVYDTAKLRPSRESPRLDESISTKLVNMFSKSVNLKYENLNIQSFVFLLDDAWVSIRGHISNQNISLTSTL